MDMRRTYKIRGPTPSGGPSRLYTRSYIYHSSSKLNYTEQVNYLCYQSAVMICNEIVQWNM